MKRVALLIAAVTMGVGLYGCASAIDATGSKDGSFLYKITGKTSAKHVYWKTDADGESSSKSKSGKYTIDGLPKRVHKYTAEVADNKSFDHSTEITIPAGKSLGSADSISSNYDDYTYDNMDSDSYLDLSDLGEEGYHLVDKQSGVSCRASVNDGKVMGITVAWDLSGDAEYVTYTLFGLGGALGANPSTLEKFVSNTTKGDGQNLTITTGGVKYQSVAIKGVLLQFNITK